MTYDIPTLIKEAEKKRWISVKERLPEIGAPVLVYCPGVHTVRIGTHHFVTSIVDFHERGPIWDARFCNREVTHWMPLPKPPEQDE